MPGFDGTGPLGYGPGSGRGLGFCGRGLRYGFGYGRRRGRGFGWSRSFGWGPAGYAFDLKGYKKYLEEELKAVNEELSREEKE